MGATYNFGAYSTPHGGVARRGEEEGTFVFVEEPSISGYKVGDLVPNDWDKQPLNRKAREENEMRTPDYIY